MYRVAPARERGLKSVVCPHTLNDQRRSREGAWIEIPTGVPNLEVRAVAPARERGLK